MPSHELSYVQHCNLCSYGLESFGILLEFLIYFYLKFYFTAVYCSYSAVYIASELQYYMYLQVVVVTLVHDIVLQYLQVLGIPTESRKL